MTNSLSVPHAKHSIIVPSAAFSGIGKGVSHSGQRTIFWVDGDFDVLFMQVVE